MKIHLFLIFIMVTILIPKSYGEVFEKDITIKIEPDGKAKIIKNLTPASTLSSIKIQPISTKIANVLATDENNVILKSVFEDAFIRIDTLGATKVRLTYDADIVKKELGLWRVLYESTNESTVVLPSGSNIVSVNTIPLDIMDDTLTMPAGEISLSYTVRTVTSNTFVVSDVELKNFVNIMTSLKVTDFNADSKSISFHVDDDGTILAIIPHNFLNGPYEVHLNKAQIEFKPYYQNTTHSWLRIEIPDGGLITISKVASVTEISDQTQQGGGCLIATATFGSELSSQVQFLREIRDNTVLSTASGTSFMTAFNLFYYLFSPAVADLERQNPAFKETVKVAITPLLSSLSLLQYVDIDSEAEMLGYGIGIILLNIGMYFVVPALVFMKIKQHFIRK